MRVKLFFRRLKDETLEQKVKGIEIIRLKALIQFKENIGWSKVYEAIVDTGAPISLIPQRIWKKTKRVELADHQVGGISKGTIPAKIGKINCILLDKVGSQSKELEIHAFLALTDQVPLIIGFESLLAEFSTCFDYKAQAAYIED